MWYTRTKDWLEITYKVYKMLDDELLGGSCDLYEYLVCRCVLQEVPKSLKGLFINGISRTESEEDKSQKKKNQNYKRIIKLNI